MKKLSMLLLLSIGVAFTSCDDDDEPAAPPDLAAHSITFKVVPSTQFAGMATIIGSVKNIGGNFTSGAGQQTALLYEKQLGGSGPGNIVGRTEFTTVTAGDSITVSYVRAWDMSSPSEGEFPPDYILQIVYDPDIAADSNDANDDADNTNNRLVVSGSAINELF